MPQEPILVNASPGSGKTFLLLERVKYLIQHYSVDPKKILLIVFTKNNIAVLNKRVGEDSFLKQFIKDIKIVNFDLMAFEWWQSQDNNNNNLTSKFEKNCFLKSIYHQKTFFLSSKIKKNQLTNIESCFSNKRKMDFLKTIIDENILNKSSKFINHKWSQISQSFDSDLAYEKYYQFDINDFSSINVEYFKNYLMTDKNEKYDAVLVDEFQDLDLLQYEMIKRLTSNNSIFCVGDVDQSIYGFRGSCPDIFQKFMQDFSKDKEEKMEENRRSTVFIVDLAKEIIAGNYSKDSKNWKNLYSSNEKGNKPICWTYNKNNNLANYIFKQINYLNKNETVALLFPQINNNKLFKELRSKFAQENEFIEENKKVSNYEKLINKYPQNETIIYAILMLNNKPDKNAFFLVYLRELMLLNEVAQEKMQIYNEYAIEYLNTHSKNEYCINSFCDFCTQKYSHEKCNIKITYICNVLKFVNHFINKWQDFATKQYAQLTIKSQLSQNIIDLLKDLKIFLNVKEFQKNDDWLNSLINHCHESTNKLPHGNLSEVMFAFCTNEDENFKSSISEQKRIVMSTIHHSKGAEYDHVYIIGVDEGTIPHRHDRKDFQLDEARRVLYVAITRAKKTIEIFCNKDRISSFINEGDNLEFKELEKS